MSVIHCWNGCTEQVHCIMCYHCVIFARMNKRKKSTTRKLKTKHYKTKTKNSTQTDNNNTNPPPPKKKKPKKKPPHKQTKTQEKNIKQTKNTQNKTKQKTKTKAEVVAHIASETLAVIIPLEIIPKDDGSVRLTHDGSLPEGFPRNAYSEHNLVRYQTIQDACLAKGLHCNKS